VQKKPAARRSAAGKKVQQRRTKQRVDPKPDVVPVQLDEWNPLDRVTGASTEANPEWAKPDPAACQVPHPDWAMHGALLLTAAGILPRDAHGKTITLNMWVDCGGISTESIAARELQRAIEVATGCVIVFKLYCLCDKDRHARRFVCQNFKPAHTSPDMTMRNFDSGLYYCDLCDENHKIPEEGIDIYIGTYPCSPWSPKGPRTGLAHPDFKILTTGLRTVNVIKPWLWLFETSDGVTDHPASGNESHLDKVNHLIKELVSVPYNYLAMKGVRPRPSGYPSRRPRFFALRWRADMFNLPVEDLVAPMSVINDNPIDSDHTYLSFLGLGTGGPNLQEVGHFCFGPGRGHPTCKCGVDPMVLCSLHPCSCEKCKKRPSLDCKWRVAMDEYLKKNMPQLLGNQPAAEWQRLTYMHALEQQSYATPQSPRVRNMLNVFAVLPAPVPLSQTDLLVDTAPTLALSTARVDGDAQTFTQGSKLWCMRAGKYLNADQKSALMGIKLDELKLRTFTEAWWHTKLGLAMHVAEAGTMLLMLLATPVGHRLRAMPA